MRHLTELADLATLSASQLAPAIEQAVQMVRGTLAQGGTLFFCGNGGSAADAQHIATEYVVRYRKERRAYAAIALTTDTSLITAGGNDYGFEAIFERQVEALCKKGDLLIMHTTSGNSPNLLRAAEAAKAKGVRTMALSAKGGGPLALLVDHCIVVPTDRTDRAQEIQLCIEHYICECAEADD